MPSETEQKELLETIINNLPHSNKKINSCSSGQVTTRFLFGLLRTANILRASEDSRAVLERKIASHLEHATLDDLLMPSYSYLVETLYDVDCVERILSYFLEELAATASTADSAKEGSEEGLQMWCNEKNKLLMAGKLMDSFLSETASDANLKPDKFCNLALALPDTAREFDDGLYHSVDVYLKAHPRISDEERESVCRVMDCQKLTLEACTHAAQNERLHLQTVVQVLFFEQLQLRREIAGTLMATEASEDEEERTLASATDERRERGAGKAPPAIRENQVLRLDVDSMRSRVQGLERECSMLRKAIERMNRRAAASSRGMLVRRLGCRFGTQVCLSHHRTVVAPRKSRRTTTEMN